VVVRLNKATSIITVIISQLKISTMSNGMSWEDVAIVVNEIHSAPALSLEGIESTSGSQQHKEQNRRNHDVVAGQIEYFDYHECYKKKAQRGQESSVSVLIGSSDDSCSSDSTETTSSISSVDCDERASVTASSAPSHVTISSLLRVPMSRIDTTLITDTSKLVALKRRQDSVSRVCFSTVHVRDYEIILGDHPYCDTYPLSVGWNYIDVLTTTTDDYEENHRRKVPTETKVASAIVTRRLFFKGNRSNKTIHIRARKLSVLERMSLLLECTGHTSQQLFHLERKRQLLVQDEQLHANNASFTVL
jgi:hypothetical protein